MTVRHGQARRALLADDDVHATEEDDVAGPVEATYAKRLVLPDVLSVGPCRLSGDEPPRHLGLDGRDRARERSAVASRAHTGHLRSDGRRR